MFAEEVSGLGVVVTITTRFDPNRIRERLSYWLDVAADDMADQVRKQINESGAYYVDENPGGRSNAKWKAMDLGMANLDWVVRSTGQKSDVMNQVKLYGFMVGKLALSYVLPWVGAVVQLISMFGGKKKKPYPIPWDQIYSEALKPAKAMTNKEEYVRLAEEEIKIRQTVEEETTRLSARAASFKLPEGVTSVSKGALVMAPTAVAPTANVNTTKTVEVMKPYVWGPDRRYRQKLINAMRK